MIRSGLKLYVVLCALCLASQTQAQLVNNQATIVVESGATLVVQGKIENGIPVPIELSQLSVEGPGIPDGVLNAGSGTIDSSVPEILIWTFDPPLFTNQDLGELFPPGISQVDIDTNYTATYLPFGSNTPEPVAIVVVPEPTSLALLAVGILVGLRRCTPINPHAADCV